MLLGLLACQSGSDLPFDADTLSRIPSDPVENAPLEFGSLAEGVRPSPPSLVARIAADAVTGDFPLVVSFDGTTSDLGTGGPRFEWDFGDGALGDGELASHTYIGEGSFEATLTLFDDLIGAESTTSVTIEVGFPPCPTTAAPVEWGHVDDGELSELSGIVSSRIDPEAYWVHEDSGQEDTLTAIDMWGATLGTYTLPELSDFEDIAIAVDPETGVSTLFLGDIGDNGHSRGDVEVYVVAEPDPRASGDLVPFPMHLDYPEGSLDSESLLVDPLTLDVFIVTKEHDGAFELYVKRAPHAEGDYVLENLGEFPFEEFTATAGDVSPDGTRIVLRDYTDTALIWMRDAYRPLEEALDQTPCEFDIADEGQGEAMGFTFDGTGVVTVSEGENEVLNYIEL
jgi:hypothetical protein